MAEPAVTPDALLLAYDFPPMPGGISRALGEIARHAGPRLVVSTGTVPSPASAGLPDDLAVDRLAVPSDRLRTIPGLARWARRGAELIAHHQPAWLWAGNLKPAGHVTRWLSRRRSVPYGVILYGSDVLRLARQVERSPVKRAVARGLLRDAGRLVAISQWTMAEAAQLCQRLGLPAAAARCEAVPLGVDASRFRPADGGRARSPWRLGAAHWLLTVGRLVPHKGVDDGLEVLGRLRRQGLDVGYLVAGSGPARDALVRRAAELGVGDRVRWLGQVPDADLPALYAAADVYLGLSRVEGVEVEGFGLALLEAAASGLPVVAGQGGGTAETVVEGVTGHLVGRGDLAGTAERVRRLLEAPDLASRFGAEGRRRAQQEFSWDRVVGALLGGGRRAAAPGPGGR